MSNTQLLINQLLDVSTRGSLSTAYTCEQLTKTLGSKHPAVDWLIVVYCSSVNFVIINATMSLYSITDQRRYSSPQPLLTGCFHHGLQKCFLGNCVYKSLNGIIFKPALGYIYVDSPIIYMSTIFQALFALGCSERVFNLWCQPSYNVNCTLWTHITHFIQNASWN